MGNDPSKARNSGAEEDDGPISIGGGARSNNGGNRSAAATAAPVAKSRSNSITTLDGHSPYIPDISSTRSPPPQSQSQGQLSFDEDRRTDLAYASLDESYSTPSTPSAAGNNSSASNDGPISIGGRRRPSQADIVQLNRAPSEEDLEAAALHPEVEAILNLAQFYPADPSYQSRAPAPADAINITPVLIRPRMVMDVYSSLHHRWSGVGQHCLRSQVMIAKEMDKLENAIQATVPAVQHRNAQLRLINDQLRQLPDLHASLQRQQMAVAKCVQTMQDLNSLLPAHLRLEDLDDIIEWREVKDEDEPIHVPTAEISQL